MPSTRVASALLAGAGAFGLLITPAASASAARPHSVARVDVAAVQPYDHTLLVDANGARVSDRRHAYRMSAKLRTIALGWAKHLATTGGLSHNPNLVRDVSKVCPNWTTIGENVGVASGPNAGQLFSAYMHSPEHKANILDTHYTVTGIETVTVIRDGVQQRWNVMDFANHCGS